MYLRLLRRFGMTRRIRNGLIGAIIAVVGWAIWSFARHTVLGAPLFFEQVGSGIPVALLGAIAGYMVTRRTPTARPEIPAISPPEPTSIIDTPSISPTGGPPGTSAAKNV
jgi:hypothetical protein